jgi:acetyl esterase/lipase
MWKYLPAIVLILLSLLSIFRAPTNFLWKVSIVITEFSWIPLLLTLIVIGIAWYFYPGAYGLHACYVLALILFLLPVSRAYSESSKLEKELQSEFGNKTGKDPKSKPYSFWNSFGLGGEEHSYEVMSYAEFDGKEYNLHFYEGNTKEEAPLVIVVHGGSWAAGDANQIPELNAYLANRGIHVAAINYRFAPKYKYPSQVEDVKLALESVKSLLKSRGLPVSKVILLGRSAGGQIVLQAGYGDLKDEVDGIVSFYAPADMLWGAKIPTNDWVLDVDKVLKDYIGCSVKENETAYLEASSPQMVDENTPPTLIIHGKIDAMVSHGHSIRLMKALKKHNVKSYLIELSSATHGCDFNFNGPSGQISTFAIERFIANL